MKFLIPKDDTNGFYPKQLIIEPTQRCNMRCFMCNMHAPHVPVGERYTLSKATFDTLRPIFPYLQYISYGGNGEPFLAKDIFWQINEVKKVNPKVHIQAFSNGLLFADNTHLLETTLDNIDELDLSIDAVTPSVYNSIRIGSDINKIFDSLSNIQRYQPLHSRCKVSIVALLMRRTISEIVPIVQIAARYSIPKVSFSGPIWTIDDITCKELIDDQSTYDKMLNELWCAKNIGKRLGVKVRFHYTPLGSVKIRKLPLHAQLAIETKHIIKQSISSLQQHFSAICTLPWRSIEVFASGVVYICCL